MKKNKREEIYVSVDIEADGPSPGQNSMISFGAAAYTIEKKLIDTFERNLTPLDGAVQDHSTMKFWKQNPVAWDYCQQDQYDPWTAMKEFQAWLYKVQTLGQFNKPVFIGYPATYDFKWIDWYFHKFVGMTPFGFSGLDMKSYAMALLQCDFRESAKRRYPKNWFDNLPHTHKALDDAIEQGAMSINILRESRGLPPKKLQK